MKKINQTTEQIIYLFVLGNLPKKYMQLRVKDIKLISDATEKNLR